MSSARPKVNLRSTAVKRIMQEAAELASADVEEDGFVAAPLEDDIFEWHCTMRGVQGSEYEQGLYHLRILLPPTYPMSAPDIMLMTPNGRFELGKKICIDGLTSFHAGSWQPAWGVRTAVVGLRSFWMQGGEALSAIGALDYSKEERRRLAGLSKGWRCPTCAVRNDEVISAVAGSAGGQPATGGATAEATRSPEDDARAGAPGEALAPIEPTPAAPVLLPNPASADLPGVNPPPAPTESASIASASSSQPSPLDNPHPASDPLPPDTNPTEPAPAPAEQILQADSNRLGSLSTQPASVATQAEDSPPAPTLPIQPVLTPTRTTPLPPTLTAPETAFSSPSPRRNRLTFMCMDTLIVLCLTWLVALLAKRLARDV
ncbi:hypothetical protein IAU60_004549 [Kwoniella sp. DSM 27419]